MIRVAVVLPEKAGDRAWDYAIPDSLAGRIGPGARVKVPIRSRSVVGTVVDVKEEEANRNLRPIQEVIGETPLILPKLLDIARWIADYYCCPIEAAMACVLPQAVRSGDVSAKLVRHIKILRDFSADELEAIAKRAPRQAEVLGILLDESEAIPLSEVVSRSGASDAVIRTMARNGWIEISSVPVGRDPYGSESFLPTTDILLNESQRVALEAVEEAMLAPAEARPILVHGVTGSGKTEVYLQSIRKALELGKTALVLVPEISLTPQTVERFKARFAGRQGEVAVLHSHLSQGERRDEWHKIHSGKACIVIGARSAVFAPLANLGVIIVDEEHETSYKQEEAPRYHARDIAVLRARLEPCAVVLGSATPSLESWHNAQTGKYRLSVMPQRVDDRRMPLLRVLDLRRVGAGGDSILAPALTLAIESRLEKGEQVILFLNRRGFSTSLQCNACGAVCQCPNCSVALTYHRDAGSLACHICGHSQRAPKKCPSCADPGIRFAGTGTQKVEDAVRRLFSKARIARMDADSMGKKNSYRETLEAFRRAEIDILIGTQMIAKGLDFPNVTLVGIVNADLGLHVPDFRAGERTFQLLTQVSGRAGRGEVEGEVFVQTFTPFSPSIQFARQHDYEGFAEQELEYRSSFGFPPFRRMVLITLRSQSIERAEFCAITLARKLKLELPEGAICGESAPAPLAKAKTYHRFQVALRGPSGRALARHVRKTLAVLPMPEDVFVAVDVDPVGLL